MQNGGYYDPCPGTAPSGAYGSGGFRDGLNAPPYCHQPPPPPPQHHHDQMTPQRREEVLMEAGRLAAEYLVAKGELPPHALRNRPPAPLPFQEGPLPPPFQERPLARQHFRFLPRGFARPFAPRPVQGRPIAKRPRPRPPAPGVARFQGRPRFHPGLRGPAPPAAPVGSMTQSQAALNDATAGGGNGDSGQPVAQPPRTME
ncbi:hypothetical protein D1007_01099 [Hordeum vulgare]|uniref:Uncharacterized protein n=1 Tax=Hordeum vulgare subsp. vulgare TaxID=112509 RepID=A0A8I6XN08_HORVV|nr:hypothetical protein D1007_01099 [Hordeum vulgare]